MANRSAAPLYQQTRAMLQVYCPGEDEGEGVKL